MQYYYYQNGQQIGPVDLDTLRSIGITADTLVWTAGMPQWQPASTLPELADLFAAGYGQCQPPYNPGVNTGYPPPSGFAKEPPICPPNYLVWAIVVTILCCWPLGIPAIVNAANVRKEFERGDYAKAERSSQNAKDWTIWSAVAGGVVAFIAFLVGTLSNSSF